MSPDGSTHKNRLVVGSDSAFEHQLFKKAFSHVDREQGPRRERLLGQILKAKGHVSEEGLAHALRLQDHLDQRIGEALIGLGYIGEDQLADGLASQFHVDLVDPSEIPIPEDALISVPVSAMRQLRIFPLERSEKTLKVAVVDPLKYPALDELRFATGCEIEWVVCSQRALERAIVKHYGTGTS